MDKLILLFIFSISLLAKEQVSESRITDEGRMLERFHFSKKFNIGLKAESWEYQEFSNGREIMRDFGTLMGFEASYEGLISDGTSFKIDASVITGTTTYDGEYLVSRREVQLESQNTIINYGGLISRVFHENYSTAFELGTGLRIRVLDNPELSNVEGDYNRRITYLYLPLGVQAKFFVNDQFHFSLGAFYKHLIRGEVETEILNSTIYLEQTEGDGVDLFADFKYTTDEYAFSIRPYYKTWIVEDSESESLGGLSFYEPQNRSVSFGAILGFNF